MNNLFNIKQMNAETHPGLFPEMPNPIPNVLYIQENCSEILRNSQAERKVLTLKDKVLHLGRATKFRLSYGIPGILRLDPEDIKPFSVVRTFETTLQVQEGVPENVKIESFERDGDPICTRVSVYRSKPLNPFDWSNRIVLIRNSDGAAIVRCPGVGVNIFANKAKHRAADAAAAKAIEEISKFVILASQELKSSLNR